MIKEEISDKICIDTQMITLTILNENFKRTLKENIRDDNPYTTELCKTEVIGNLKYILNISWKEATDKFERFRSDFNVSFLEFKTGYHLEGKELYEKVLNSNIHIKNKKTLLVDCINLITIIENKIKIYFSNDEDLSKICRTFNIDLEFVRITDSTNKTIKDAFKKPKFRYWKKGQRVEK